jgi:glutamate-1-semialdehyde aminotransferase/spore coat polysaccharide biosynthesis protein SpsF (cytidylyltransferase family)
MQTSNKVLAIIQARYDSKRFPGKVLKKINKKTILEILIKRLLKSNNISKIVVACSKNVKDKSIIDICKKLNIDYFSGSENNVLERFYKAAQKYKGLNIVRITADCPLIDSRIVDEVITNYFYKKVDYASNINPPTFPDGLDVEIFKFSVLKKAYLNAKKKIDKEHVTPFIINNKQFKKFNLRNFKDYSSIRLTLDEQEDLVLIEQIVNKFKNNLYFSFADILKLYKAEKSIFLINSHLTRNEGQVLNLGQKTWKRAKKVIAGGSMLFSKNPDLYLPGKWPAYFTKTKGCHIWDLEGNKFLDMSVMGLGTNILGYSNTNVDAAVKKVISLGNLSTLNCKEEVLLAEKLVELHPWSQMVRHVRTGAEANSVAIRLARAATGKNKIAICGYHGWQDWYLSANLKNINNLNNHLLKKTPAAGVDKNLKNSILTFNFNEYQKIEYLTKSNDIAAIIIELARNIRQDNSFLIKLRNLCNKKNIVLIFDECTSGFREAYGGLHLKYGINPDIATFGKALGNGYSICSVVGKSSVMESLQNTFVSSTFWTDRIGPAAALKTLEIMKKTKSWEKISIMGRYFKKELSKLINLHKLKIEIQGLDALPKYSFNENNKYYKTFISQEFLKRSILANNCIYLCVSHDEKKINNYLNILDNIFTKIKKNINKNIHPSNLLEGNVCISSLRE